MKVLFLLSLFVLLKKLDGAELETVNDDELLSLIKNEKLVVVLFTKPDCSACSTYESLLLESRDELVDALGAWVVRATKSPLIRLYSPNPEPALVFFRHGVPMLYDGPMDEDHIVQTFIDNKEPNVRELADDNFEHLTQAATGATTGDWFVMFYSPSCLECQRLSARWEAVGAAGRGRGLLTARADRSGPAAATARRFGVTKDPTFLLFRKGKMYWYDIPKYDTKSFVSFAQDWFNNAKSEKVPLPKTPFDDLVAWCVYMIRDIVDLVLGILSEHPWIWQIGVVGFGLVAVTAVIAVVKAGKSASPVKSIPQDEESEEEEDEDDSPSAKPAKKQSKKTK